MTTTTEQTALTSAEQKRLHEFESTIEHGLQTFYEVGYALAEIREQRLYRAEYGTFEDYCTERWKMRRNYANKLIAASEIAGNLGTTVPRPTSERQARPLSKLPPEEQAPAWEEAVERSGGKPTARHVEEVVKERTEPPAPEPQRSELPPGWYWQQSSNPADIIAINGNRHDQISGFCPTHEEAARVAWEVHQTFADVKQAPAREEPAGQRYTRVDKPTAKARGELTVTDQDMLNLQKKGYFFDTLQRDDKGLLYLVFWHQSRQHRILQSNIPAFINQAAGYEYLMLPVVTIAEPAEEPEPAEGPAQPAAEPAAAEPAAAEPAQRITDLSTERLAEVTAAFEAAGYDAKVVNFSMIVNRKGSPGHNAVVLYEVEELESKLQIARQNFEAERLREDEKRRLLEEDRERLHKKLPEQQPVCDNTIAQCMIEAYRLVKSGQPIKAYTQAQRFRAYPHVVSYLQSAIIGMTRAMEQDGGGNG